MMVTSVTTTEEERRFRTFANYIASVALLCRAEWGSSAAMVESYRDKVKVKQAKLPCDRDRVASFLRRAWATESLMNLPFTRAELSEVIPHSILWLPVQTYYTVFSALQAVLIAQGDSIEKHAIAMSHFSNTLRFRMPFPFCCSALGHDTATRYERFRNDPDKDFSTLARPQNSDDANHLLGTALRSTRRQLLEDKCDAWKREHGKKQIPRTQRQAIGEAETPTTILHFLYRLRVRSNYGDSEVFVSGSSAADARNFAKAYISVVDYFLGALEVMADKRLGADSVKREATDFVREARGVPPVAARWDIPIVKARA
jgi:hypothetical protein